MLKLSKIEEERASSVHEKSIFVNMRDPTYTLYNYTLAEKPGYFAKLREGGVTTSNIDVAWVEDDFREVVDAMYAWYERVNSSVSEKAIIVKKSDDIEKAKSEGKISFIFSLQSASPIEDDLNILDVLHKLGLSSVELTYQSRNLVGDGVGEKSNAGLSKFGVRLVEAMNRIGMLIDLSHVGYKTSMETLELSRDPVIFSHSNARKLVDHIRNLSDEQIQTVSEKGGLVGISAFASFLRVGGGDAGAMIEDYLDHVDYVAKLAGVDHVGIGLDVGEDRTSEESNILEGSARIGHLPKVRYVEDLNSYSKAKNITRGLVSRGYSDQEIGKILGGNFLRVFKKVCK